MILQDTYEVKKADIIPVEVSVPGSKSITNRALLIAALANGKSVLKGVLFSDDSRHFLQALQDLGFVVEIDEPHAVVSIEGKGGGVPKTKASTDRYTPIRTISGDRKSTRLNSSHRHTSRMPSSA